MKKLKYGILVMLMALLSAGCQEKINEFFNFTSQKNLSAVEQIKKAGVLRWGADVVGCEPYVYEDPKVPGQYIGFEMDIAKAIAKQMGVELELVVRAWDSLIPELQGNSFDMAMNGIEDTADRSKIVHFSDPYFVYSQQISVASNSEDITSLDDLIGKKVATLSGTAAEDILRSKEGIEVIINPEIFYSYKELEDGKVDAVVIDTPIAVAYAKSEKVKNVGETFGPGNYVIAFRLEDSELKDEVNSILNGMKSTGELASIYRKWGIMNGDQQNIGIM